MARPVSVMFVFTNEPSTGAVDGGVAGFVVGLFQDILTGGIFGFHILTRTALGYYVGYTKEKVFKDSILYNVVAIGVMTFFLRACYLIVQIILAKNLSLLLLGIAVQNAIAYCLGNILFMIPFYLLTEKIQQWIESDDGLH